MRFLGGARVLRVLLYRLLRPSNKLFYHIIIPVVVCRFPSSLCIRFGGFYSVVVFFFFFYIVNLLYIRPLLYNMIVEKNKKTEIDYINI